MAATRGPTTRRDVLTAGALALLVAAGGAAAALLSLPTARRDEPETEAAPVVAAAESGQTPTDVEDVPDEPVEREARAADAAAPEEAVPGRFALPAIAVGPLAERPEERPAMQVWLVEESADDPSGVVVTGPLGVEVHDAAKGKASVARSGRVRRWWFRSGDRWHRGDETAERTDGAPASFADVGWGPHGLLRLLDHRGRAVEDGEVTLQFSDLQHRRDLARVRTDADGLALFRLPDDKPSRLVPTPPAADATVYRVEVPVVPPVTAPYSREGPWPAVIRLPPLGAVEVRLVASGGDAPAGHVRLEPLVEGSQVTGFVPSVVAPVVGSGVRFPQVGTGLRFAAVLMPGNDRVSTRVGFEGPAGAGRTVKVDLPFGGLRPVFAGRLLAATGGPAYPAGVQLTLPLVSARSRWEHRTDERASTSPDGRFEVRPDVDLAAADSVEVTVSAGAQELLRRRIGRVAPGANVDLGVLRLGEAATAPLLVAGRVLDERGLHVGGLHVSAWRRRAETWEPVGGAPTFTSDDGAFEVRRDAVPAAEWQVRVAHSVDGRVADPVPFVVGESGVSIRLRPTASVQVRVLLPPVLEHGHGPVLALQGEVAQASGRSDPAAGGGAFGGSHTGGYHVFGVLAGGTGRIVAFPPGLPERVLATKDVTVEPGVRNDAGTLDLRGVVPVRTVRVLGPDGKGAADGAVWWRTSDATSPIGWNAVTCRPDGTASVPGMTPVDLLAHRTGSGFAGASRVTADVALTPPPAGKPSAVEVRVADGLDVPAPPFRFTVGLFLVDEGPRGSVHSKFTDPRNANRQRAPLERETRRARFEVAERGRHVAWLTLLLERPDGTGSGVPVELEAEASTDLSGDGSPRTIVLRWRPEALAAATARLRGD